MEPDILLIIARKPERAAKIIEILNKNKLKCDLTLGVEEAKSKISEKEYQVAIYCMSVDDINGECQIAAIKKYHDDLVFIVVTNEKDIRAINSSFGRFKPFDYLIAPFEEKELLEKTTHAYELYMVARKMQLAKYAEQEYFKDAVKIFDWKYELAQSRFDFHASRKIRQVNIGLFHGGGIGGLISSLSLAMKKGQKCPETGNVEFSAKYHDLLEENYHTSRVLVNGLAKAQNILMTHEVVTETADVEEMYKLFEKQVTELQDMLAIKEQRIILSDAPKRSMGKSVLFDREMLETMIRELFINAMKYTEKKENIYVLIFNADKGLDIKIVNRASKNEDGTVGIDNVHEHLVFEPFYRINNVAFEAYKKEEFTAGIGLSVVKGIVARHNGAISMRNINNYMGTGLDKDVVVSLLFRYV